MARAPRPPREGQIRRGRPGRQPPPAAAAATPPGDTTSSDETSTDTTSSTPAADPPPVIEAAPPVKPLPDLSTPVIDSLDRTRIAIPLLDRILDPKAPLQNVIIDANLLYGAGRKQARLRLWEIVDSLPGVTPTYPARVPAPGTAAAVVAGGQGINFYKSQYSEQYLFGVLSGDNIRELVRRSEAEGRAGAGGAPLYRVWLDHDIMRFTNRSISTVKADAARNAFNALGRGIVWAVVDTGVDATHPHFQRYRNLDLKPPLLHRDFTGAGTATPEDSSATARIDMAGHGTHVAGIVAGFCKAEATRPIQAEVRQRDEAGTVTLETLSDIEVISGMAPECGILSLKVLGDDGRGQASNLIAALEYLQELNGNGRHIMVQGVNLSVGYDFEPKWFACGQSPLCVEVDRLVRSGVVVVVAAGNTGYGFNQVQGRGSVAAGQDLTINDPGNAELAITVGSTHREMPHVYGVSYFSSKGPTGDGRLKPDLVAPGEKIISCRSGSADPVAAPAPDGTVVPSRYKEDSGTSMAAPHVSGVIASFLSVRREFIGRPEAVKDIFLQTSTDLKRAVYFQGKGLVDLMRAIQSV